jgi:transglutaminase-like putative cysteine protease
MSFATYFRSSSYAMVAVATLALFLAGGVHLALAALFAAILIVAWKIEGSKWQLSERLGLAIVILSIPLFFLDWQYQKELGEAREKLGANALAHLIIFLSAIKLLQVKSDRDWVFLYLISFFEVLLAAGLSLSPVFLATLTLYLLCGLSTIIAFEIRKAGRAISAAETRILIPPDSRVFSKLVPNRRRRNSESARLPLISFGLLLLIFVLALPLFVVAPRAGSAMITRSGLGLSNFIGFSENVSLGAIGELKQNDEVVMRVRLDDPEARREDFRWRGVALDEFSGRSWRKSADARRITQETSDRGFFQLGTTEDLHRLTTQTVFLEPIDSAVLFAATRAVAVQGDFPFVRMDAEGSIQTRRHDSERIIYKVFSDLVQADPTVLRRDMRPYPAAFDRYLQLPQSFDPRITDLAQAMISRVRARNRYDAAKAIETQLRSDYGYSLTMKASGPDPLADFLFNIRAGHCEYFSTAMAVMLRTHGIAARVVNGFLPGEYNEASGAFTVRQSDAHSWVEVYFPETKSWVTFDPTPAAGRTEPVRSGLAAQLGKYAEAFELIWYQYVVGYDKQEQRSLASSLHDRAFRYQHLLANIAQQLSQIAALISRRPLLAIMGLALMAIVLWQLFRLKRFGWRGLGVSRSQDISSRSAVEFYERLTRLLAQQGITRAPDQTPLEFAAGAGFDEAVSITRAYNRVRYGAAKLSGGDQKHIEQWLAALEKSQKED